MQARIRYLAITARDPQALAHDYALHFGLWLLGESEGNNFDISATHGFEVDHGVWINAASAA